MKRIFALLWAAWLGFFLFVEGIAVGNPAEGDTFSELVWILSQYRLVEVVLVGLWGWLGYHFFVQPRLERRRQERDDL